MLTCEFKNVKLNSSKRRRQGGERVAFDYSRLKGRIVEKYGTQSNFVKAFGISENSFSLKMNNKSRFNSDDIIKMTEMLDIEKEDVGTYFFTPKV